jgi:hypothetical protein
VNLSRKLLFFSLALISLQFSAWSQQPESGSVLQSDAEQLMALANQSRSASGAEPLKWDGALAVAARKHCLRMAAEGPISHRYPGELDLSERAGQAEAHFSLIEENVAIGPSPAWIHDEWMHSSGHRTNLLNPEVDRVGIAVVASRGVLYAVADYARGVQSLSPSQVEARIAGLIRQKGVAIAGDPGFARAACAMNSGVPNSAGGSPPGFIMRWQDSDMSVLPDALAGRLASGRYHQAAIGSCSPAGVDGTFTAYRVAVLLY